MSYVHSKPVKCICWVNSSWENAPNSVYNDLTCHGRVPLHLISQAWLLAFMCKKVVLSLLQFVLSCFMLFFNFHILAFLFLWLISKQFNVLLQLSLLWTFKFYNFAAVVVIVQIYCLLLPKSGKNTRAKWYYDCDISVMAQGWHYQWGHRYGIIKLLYFQKHK